VTTAQDGGKIVSLRKICRYYELRCTSICRVG